jgi:hypothetical protein
VTWRFADLRGLLARACPARSGDALAGLAASCAEERMATRFALADLPLRAFLGEALVPYEADGVTRVIVDGHDAGAVAPLAHLTVGELREWHLEETTSPAELSAVAPGAHARDGGGGLQAHVQPGPRPGGEEVPGGVPLPRHPRARGGALGGKVIQPMAWIRGVLD